MHISLVGGPAPFREAMAARLSERGHTVSSGPDAHPVSASEGQSRSAAVFYCDNEVRWEALQAQALTSDCVAIAVLPELDLDHYIRALLAGAAGVVFGDTSSELMADTIGSAINGEVSIPRQVAQSMAALARREPLPSELDDVEVRLLKGVAGGTTIGTLADELHYSDRTVRRHLQSLYIKLGVKNRAEAIAVATRLGILD